MRALLALGDLVPLRITTGLGISQQNRGALARFLGAQRPIGEGHAPPEPSAGAILDDIINADTLFPALNAKAEAVQVFVPHDNILPVGRHAGDDLRNGLCLNFPSGLNFGLGGFHGWLLLLWMVATRRSYTAT